MSMQVKDFEVPACYQSVEAVPSYPMDAGANVLKTSDQQIQLMNRLFEKIENSTAKMEAIRESIANLEVNLSGPNEKLNYNRILQRVQDNEWVTPTVEVTEELGYSDPEKNQVHVRLWHLGATNEEEYPIAKAQFENNIKKLERGLSVLKNVKLVKEQSYMIPALLGMTAYIIAVTVLPVWIFPERF